MTGAEIKELATLTTRMSAMAGRVAREGYGRNEESTRATLWARIERGNQILLAAAGDPPMLDRHASLVERFYAAEERAREIL